MRTSIREGFCKRFRGLLTQVTNVVRRDTELSACSARSWDYVGWPSVFVDESDAAAEQPLWWSGNSWGLHWGVQDLYHGSICSWTLSLAVPSPGGVSWLPCGKGRAGSWFWRQAVSLELSGRHQQRLHTLTTERRENGSLWAKHCLDFRNIITATQKCL